MCDRYLVCRCTSARGTPRRGGNATWPSCDIPRRETPATHGSRKATQSPHWARLATPSYNFYCSRAVIARPACAHLACHGDPATAGKGVARGAVCPRARGVRRTPKSPLPGSLGGHKLIISFVSVDRTPLTSKRLARRRVSGSSNAGGVWGRSSTS